MVDGLRFDGEQLTYRTTSGGARGEVEWKANLQHKPRSEFRCGGKLRLLDIGVNCVGVLFCCCVLRIVILCGVLRCGRRLKVENSVTYLGEFSFA